MKTGGCFVKKKKRCAEYKDLFPPADTYTAWHAASGKGGFAFIETSLNSPVLLNRSVRSITRNSLRRGLLKAHTESHQPGEGCFKLGGCQVCRPR